MGLTACPAPTTRAPWSETRAARPRRHPPQHPIGAPISGPAPNRSSDNEPGRTHQSPISSTILSLIREMVPFGQSLLTLRRIPFRNAPTSPPVNPRALSASTLWSTPSNRRWHLCTRTGLSCRPGHGGSISTRSTSVSTVLVRVPLQELRIAVPAHWSCFSYTRWLGQSCLQGGLKH
jgi:hypothetical protein